MPEFDNSIGERWHEDFQGFMHKSREKGCGFDDEFGAQQEIYTKVRGIVFLVCILIFTLLTIGKNMSRIYIFCQLYDCH